MGPAEQRLDRRDAACAQIQLGLVAEGEVSTLDCQLQFLDQTEPVALAVDLLLVDLKLGISQLGAVHGQVSTAHEASTVRGVGRSPGGADAGADADADLDP